MMHWELLEERIVFLFVIISLPALVYALQKLAKKRIFNKMMVVFIYFVLFYCYIEAMDQLYRQYDSENPERMQRYHE